MKIILLLVLSFILDLSHGQEPANCAAIGNPDIASDCEDARPIDGICCVCEGATGGADCEAISCSSDAACPTEPVVTEPETSMGSTSTGEPCDCPSSTPGTTGCPPGGSSSDSDSRRRMGSDSDSESSASGTGCGGSSSDSDSESDDGTTRRLLQDSQSASGDGTTDSPSDSGDDTTTTTSGSSASTTSECICPPTSDDADSTGSGSGSGSGSDSDDDTSTDTDDDGDDGDDALTGGSRQLDASNMLIDGGSDGAMRYDVMYALIVGFTAFLLR